MGFTCATCHTGEITQAGNRYLVEGGQANLDMIAFLLALGDAIEANQANSSKKSRYKSRFFWNTVLQFDWPINPFSGSRYLEKSRVYVRGFTGRNASDVPGGPARLDAIGSIINELHVHHANISDDNAVPPVAPVSYPYIWDLSDLQCTQTNCVSNNPIDRNVGEVLGVFGYMNIEDSWIPNFFQALLGTAGWNLFEATPKVDNVYKLDRALAKAHSPKWPDTFPPLDPQLITLGSQLYTQHCSSCHIDTTDGVDGDELTEPNSIGRRFTKVIQMEYSDIGTDPAFAEDFGLRKVNSGLLGDMLSYSHPDSINPETGIPFGDSFPEEFNSLVLLGVATGALKKDHYASIGFIIRTIFTYPELSWGNAVDALITEYAVDQVDGVELLTTSYRAKPLDGIAFTGPYLHNGSVRTLRDLLKAPENRPTSFFTGTTEYDLDGAGYMDGGSFYLDTTIRGNYKEGHIYGTELSDLNKEALLEYLKSL
ncbi:MAG: hypothetical protein COA43_03795 [Robiginitomaculum sp.]|nr:MAG: hypothetical protein COA43_03795 [Robiginitomaculum sp.]